MFVVIFSSLFALLFTWLESRRSLSNGMLIGFIPIILIGCLHYNYGNDYMSYLMVYEHIRAQPFDLSAVLDGEIYREPGWVILNYLFVPLGGFFTLVAVLSIVQGVLVYSFIRLYVDKRSWVWALFVFLFVTDYFLLSLSMMRQEFVMIVFLSLWSWIRKRYWLRCLLVICLLSFIHSTAMILFPFAFWGYLPARSAKLVAVIYIVLFLLLWTNRGLIDTMLQSMSKTEDLEDYIRVYKGNKVTSFGLGFILKLFTFFVFLSYLLNNKNGKDKQLIAIACVGTLIIPFTQVIALLGRLGMYFGIYQIAAVPIAYKGIRSPMLRLILTGIFFVSVLWDYYLFFKDSIYSDYYDTFYTIFEA